MWVQHPFSTEWEEGRQGIGVIPGHERRSTRSRGSQESAAWTGAQRRWDPPSPGLPPTPYGVVPDITCERSICGPAVHVVDPMSHGRVLSADIISEQSPWEGGGG